MSLSKGVAVFLLNILVLSNLKSTIGLSAFVNFLVMSITSDAHNVQGAGTKSLSAAVSAGRGSSPIWSAGGIIII